MIVMQTSIPNQSKAQKSRNIVCIFSVMIVEAEGTECWCVNRSLYHHWLQAFLFFFKFVRLNCNGKNARNEPKGIVFLSQLLLLFQNCFSCFASSPDISVTQTGTMISVTAKCHNCQETRIWKSQPNLLGFPAGNILLSFGILCAGASVTKVLRVLKHIGILVYQKPTFYYHQRNLLIPSILGYWKSYQKNLLARLKGSEVVLAGDGRHDSMGHSAKFGTYTIFCCTIGLILHIVIVQVHQILVNDT